MASLSTNKKNGRRKIQFNFNGKRHTINLGKVAKRQAENVKLHIERLVAARLAGHAVPDQTAVWLAEIDTKLSDDLAKHGLTESTRSRHPETLLAFIDSYIASRTDVKPATKEIWRQGRNGLAEHFGSKCRLADISPGDADGYKMDLLKTLKTYTVRKRLYFATLVFRAAMRHRVIRENPFEGVTVKVTMEDRQHFVTRKDVAKILQHCPSSDWRLIVALARYGGLRCPSEVLSVRWCDVIWSEGKLHVTSPKTAHHAGKESRVVPLFPELREILEAEFDMRFLETGYDDDRDGETYVVNERYRQAALGPAGWRNVNLRTTLLKIVKRAGISAWPRLLHNLRSSRETELADEYPIHVVAGWMGHSVKIATKHYTQITDDHFSRACVALPKSTQNPTQHTSATVSNALQTKQVPNKKPREKQPDAASCGAVRINEAEGKGFEPSTRYRANTGSVAELDAESDALLAVDPQLAEVAAMWSKITEEQRLQIVNIVRETS